jgi:hypothetical protein
VGIKTDKLSSKVSFLMGRHVIGKSLKGLARLRVKYARNYDKMVATMGTPKHKVYCRIEDEYDCIEVGLRKHLGVYVYDPCPLKRQSVPCERCTGWYSKDDKGKYVSASAGNGVKCKLSDFATGKMAKVLQALFNEEYRASSGKMD